jgi:putative NIF3 family GTP cyclohydrolase 1 type 2
VTTVKEVCELLEGWFPAQLAESWDAVGLVVGRPENPVTSVLLTVDVTEETVAEAITDGVDLIIAHHPLLFGGVTSVAATDYKGRIIHDLIGAKSRYSSRTPMLILPILECLTPWPKHWVFGTRAPLNRLRACA